jgi:membrane protease subunit HflC
MRGEGEAERNRILGEAYGRDPEFFSFYRSLQAYDDALSAETTTMVLSPDNPFFKYFQKGQTGGR